MTKKVSWLFVVLFGMGLLLIAIRLGVERAPSTSAEPDSVRPFVSALQPDTHGSSVSLARVLLPTNFDEGPPAEEEPFQQELLDKGYPLVPGPRAKILGDLNKQTVEQSIQHFDPIHFMLAGMMNGGMNMPGTASDLSTYATSAPGNPWTMRIYQACAKNPNIIPLVKQELKEEISDFSSEYKRLLALAAGNDYSESGQAAHGFYAEKVYKIASLQYILLNLKVYDDMDSLKIWLKKPGGSSNDWDMWLLWHIAQTSSIENAHSKATILDLGKKYNLSEGFKAQSAWDESWTNNDPMLKMRNVDSNGLKTIQMLSIPFDLQVSDADHDKLLDSFLTN